MKPSPGEIGRPPAVLADGKHHTTVLHSKWHCQVAVQSISFTATKQRPHAPLHCLGPGGTFMVTAGTYRKVALFGSPQRLDLVTGCLFSPSTQKMQRGTAKYGSSIGIRASRLKSPAQPAWHMCIKMPFITDWCEPPRNTRGVRRTGLKPRPRGRYAAELCPCRLTKFVSAMTLP